MKTGWLIGMLIAQFAVAQAAFSCDVTLPKHRPIVPDGAMRGGSSTHDWYGSPDLAALIPINGQWKGMGEDRQFSDKFWWWRQGFDAHSEPHPDLVIRAKRLDGPADPVRITRVTHGKRAHSSNSDSMLVSMKFPVSGCWEVRGTYEGFESLRLVFWVGE